MQYRRRLSFRYLRGSGLEIGGLNLSLPVAEGVRVTYVDRLQTEALLRQYPELAAEILVPVDVVDDGERLPKFADETKISSSQAISSNTRRTPSVLLRRTCEPSRQTGSLSSSCPIAKRPSIAAARRRPGTTSAAITSKAPRPRTTIICASIRGSWTNARELPLRNESRTIGASITAFTFTCGTPPNSAISWNASRVWAAVRIRVFQRPAF